MQSRSWVVVAALRVAKVLALGLAVGLLLYGAMLIASAHVGGPM